MSKADQGSGRRPLTNPAFLWADGIWRKDRPPSEENITLMAHELSAEQQHHRQGPKTVLLRKPVPKKFKQTDYTRLRQTAISLAIQGASALYRPGTATPEQILEDAEGIARWIADTSFDQENP